MAGSRRVRVKDPLVAGLLNRGVWRPVLRDTKVIFRYPNAPRGLSGRGHRVFPSYPLEQLKVRQHLTGAEDHGR